MVQYVAYSTFIPIKSASVRSCFFQLCASEFWVIKSDFEEAGDDDVFRKVRGDFDAAGIEKSDHQIKRQMQEMMALAIEQIKSEAD